MKRIITTIFVFILMALMTFAVGITAETNLIKEEQAKIAQQTMFEAEVTFTIQTSTGCGCDPIPGATINAYGGEGSVSGVTDDQGVCVLTLVILGEYEVIIEADDYQEIDFEFDVVDDQSFIFHMYETDESSYQMQALSANQQSVEPYVRR